MESDDRGRAWTLNEIREIYNEKLRPKTYTLYNDAMASTDNQENLYQLMSLLITQTLSDLYATYCLLNQAEQISRFDFMSMYFTKILELYKQVEEQPKRLN